MLTVILQMNHKSNYYCGDYIVYARALQMNITKPYLGPFTLIMGVAACWAGRVWARPLSGARRLPPQCNLQRSPKAIFQICTHALVRDRDRLNYG